MTPAPLDPAATAITCPRCNAAPAHRCWDLRTTTNHDTGQHPLTTDRVHRTRYDTWLQTPTARTLADIALTAATRPPTRRITDHGRPAHDPQLRADLVQAAATLVHRITALDTTGGQP